MKNKDLTLKTEIGRGKEKTVKMEPKVRHESIITTAKVLAKASLYCEDRVPEPDTNITMVWAEAIDKFDYTHELCTMFTPRQLLEGMKIAKIEFGYDPDDQADDGD